MAPQVELSQIKMALPPESYYIILAPHVGPLFWHPQWGQKYGSPRCWIRYEGMAPLLGPKLPQSYSVCSSLVALDGGILFYTTSIVLFVLWNHSIWSSHGAMETQPPICFRVYACPLAVGWAPSSFDATLSVKILKGMTCMFDKYQTCAFT